MFNRRLTLAVVGLAILQNVSAYAQNSRGKTQAKAPAAQDQSQALRDQYERALSLRERYRNTALNIADSPTWMRGGGHRFWYRKSVEGGSAYVMVDADAGTRAPAFDHDKIAAALNQATGGKYTAGTLPFRTPRFTDGAVEFPLDGARWRCDTVKNTCSNQGAMRMGGFGNFIFDEGPGGGRDRTSVKSPDNQWEAFIQNYNVYLRPARPGNARRGPETATSADQPGADGTRKTDYVALSTDGSEGNYYSINDLWWSPDSQHLVAYRTRPGYDREVHYVESSPTDQLQPKHSTMKYNKPGDVLDLDQPVLFDIASRKQIHIDNALFPNPYQLQRVAWWKDNRAFTFEYNQRGHQLYSVVEVDAATGKPRELVSETSKTFIDYPRLSANMRDHGWIYRYDVDDGAEIIWMSEKDGWPHLYLYNGKTGALENQITKGNWDVRAVDYVDEAKRQIYFEASGMYPGKDPYYVYAYRIRFDGSGMTRLTEAEGNHELSYSPDGKYYVDSVSTVDTAPVTQLRKTEDNSLVLELEKGDIQKLTAAGWKAPEIFTAMGRDGKTDIWGLIYKPANFNPAKKYPVIENIYAGPQGSFVPKSFSTAAEPLTEMGFIVVHIDGMGTNNRSKAFHDISWKNLKDAGLEDRILWHKAAAAKFPWYDVSQGVGIFGTSAGGQNTMSALLFHPEFYKVGVSNSGSHDNRMDKIWWNELWMGWPIGPEYGASSNVDNAWRLQGKLLLVMGEMDKNVDPSSTMQVINALIKANKKFSFLDVPGGGHGAGGLYGQRLLIDFFVHNLMHSEPPDWNASAPLPALTRPPAPPGM